MQILKWFASCCLMAGVFGVALAAPADEDLFLQLRLAVHDQLATQSEDVHSQVQAASQGVESCRSDLVEGQGGPQYSQYIYNANYVWSTHNTVTGFCIYLLRPIRKPLTFDEALDLISGSRMQFPVPKDEPVQPNDVIPHPIPDLTPPAVLDGSGNTPPRPDSSKVSPEKDGRADTRVRVTSNSFPYYAITYVQTDGSSGSAVQISPYVFMTAAHVLTNQYTGEIWTGAYVLPGYNVPNITPAIPASSVFDTNYYPSRPDSFSHDIGFLRIAAAHYLPQYPQIFMINSSVDHGFYASDPCPYGNSGVDAFARAGGLSWYSGFTWIPGNCYPLNNTVVVTAGYPEVVNGVSNSQVFAYQDPSGFIDGLIVNGGALFELQHPVGGSSGVMGLSSFVSSGDSGGPVFGRDGSTWVLFGVVGVATSLGNDVFLSAIAAGAFDYNIDWVISNRDWNPTNPIVLTSPRDGGTYPREAVPDLRATAGANTAQLQWTSNFDGLLGTGGDVPVANRLTPGAQVITATLPSGVLAAEADKALETVVQRIVHITVTGSLPPPQPYVYVSPNPVTIPYGQTTANANVSWTSVCDGDCDNWRTDISYKLNGGSYVYWKEDVPAGSDVFALHAGDSVTFYAYQHHFAETAGHNVTVNCVQGAQPTFSITPTHITVPAGQTSGTYSMSWTAPGYQSVDLWGRFDNTGPWSGPVGALPNSNYGDSLSVNRRVTWRTYAPGSAGPNSTQPNTGFLREVTTYASH